MYLKRMEHI